MRKILPVLAVIVAFIIFYFGSFAIITILLGILDIEFYLKPTFILLASTGIAYYGCKWTYNKTKDKMKEI
jgi:hypothetical protein